MGCPVVHIDEVLAIAIVTIVVALVVPSTPGITDVAGVATDVALCVLLQ